MADRIRAFDWAATSLEPIDRWPQSLATAVDLMLASAQPAYIGWGPDLISLYNDGYIAIAGNKHPASLGQPYRLMWTEIWDDFRPVADAVLAGESRYFEDQPVPLAGRPGKPTSWFTFSWTPLRDDDGVVAGFYCAAVETTERVLADRERDRNYRALFDAIDEGYLLADVILDDAGKARDIAFVDANPAAIRITGPDVAGRRLRDIDPDHEDHWYEIFGRVAQTGMSERLEGYAGSSGRWYDFYVCKPAPDDPASNRVAALFHDISERKLGERRQAFMLRLSDALRLLADPIEIQRTAMRALGEHLQVNRAFYGDAQDDRDTLVIGPGYSQQIPPLEGQVRFSDFELDMAKWYEAGRTYVIDDTQRDDRFGAETKAGFAAIQVGAALGVPLAKGGRVRAIVSLHQSTPRQWTAVEIKLAEEVAERTWAAVERARAEDALRESEARYRNLFGTMRQGYVENELIRDAERGAVDYRTMAVNPQFERLTGVPTGEAIGRTARELVKDLDPAWVETYACVVRTGEPAQFEREEPAFDRWFEVQAYPLIGDRFAILYDDVTERRRTDAALRESETRLQTLIEGVPQLVWRAVDDGCWTWASPQWTEFTGQAEADSHGQGWLDPVHPDDRERVRAIWAGAVERGEFHADYRLCNAAQRRYAWFQTRATPVRDAGGEVIEWLGTSTDVDDLRSLQERQKVLVGELQHRVRNMLTVVRAVFSQTMEAEGDAHDQADHFRGRLDALARTQVIVTRSARGLVDLEDLIRDELLSVTADRDGRVTIAGPDVALSAKAAESIGLAIHELTTNALNYGALKVSGGTLDIRWAINIGYGDSPRLIPTWTEQGVPAVGLKPGRRGFGSELIEEALPYRLGAETALEFRGGGVRCTIAIALSDDVSGADPYREEPS